MFKITGQTLAEIREDYGQFKVFFHAYSWHVAFSGAKFVPAISGRRLRDAHTFWINDLKRLALSFKDTGRTPDYYKQAAHLAYWLRRQNPVTSYRDGFNPQDGGSDGPTVHESEVRELLRKYGGEFLAFDLGFQICDFYERMNLTNGKTEPPPAFKLDRDYINTMVYFLKTKNVSPHALFLVYKALFFRRY